MSNQVVALVSGMLRAARVKPPKITAACSHFGPSSTRVSGWASARNKPVKKNAINAIASYRCRNVDRYRFGSDCNLDKAGMKTALIGIRNWYKGFVSRTLALE